MSIDDTQPRSLALAMRRGAFGRCPRCGEGHLFSRFLKIADHCDACGTPFHHHRADDLPAYIVIFVVGHVVIGGMLSAETNFDWPIWQHVLIWPLLTVVLSLLLLQPIKGAIVGLQWALRMHGFGHQPDGDDRAVLRPHAGEPRP